MTHEKKKLLTGDIGLTLMAIATLLFITRLWPILLLLLIGLIAYALWMLCRVRRQPVISEPMVSMYALPKPETEESMLNAAFGLLQRRITEEVVSKYPDARWVWSTSDAFRRFSSGGQLSILLNRADGYRTADVLVTNLQFAGLNYQPVPDNGKQAPKHTANESEDDEYPEPEEVDYGLLAFEWVEANLQKLNTQVGAAVSAQQDSFRIPAEELPHGDGWPAVCEELMRNGFLAAKPLADGIRVKVKTEQE